MKRHLVILLITLAGCGEIAGITDLTSDQAPDGGSITPVVDAGPDVVASDADVGDTSPPIDATEADKGFRRVFVTSGAYAFYPNMGTASADTQCQKAANDNQLDTNGEQWVAWLGAGSIRAIDRLPFAGSYRLLTATVVVNQRDQLKGGTLLHAIDINEKGLVAEGDNDQRRVWTGTAANGNIANDCTGWTASGNLGQIGRAYLSDGRWTDDGFAACGLAFRLYCFEK